MEGEENKLTTFSTWTIVLGCNESNIIFQQHLVANLGNSGEAMVEIHIPYIKVMPGYFLSFVKATKNSQAYTVGIQTYFAHSSIWPEKKSYGSHTFLLFVS